MNPRSLITTALAAATTLWAGAALAGSQSESIDANDTAAFSWTADASGEIIVSIDGDGETDLDLFVYDDNGNLLGADRSLDDDEQVRLTVREGREYEIQVQNLGNVTNEFDLEMAFVDESVSDRVNANDRVNYDYRAPRGGDGEIVATLHGDGDTDLDLFIYDSRGRLVVEGLSLDDHERLVFDAIPGEEYQIVVSNLGDVYNEFTLDIEE